MFVTESQNYSGWKELWEVPTPTSQSSQLSRQPEWSGVIYLCKLVTSGGGFGFAATLPACLSNELIHLPPSWPVSHLQPPSCFVGDQSSPPFLAKSVSCCSSACPGCHHGLGGVCPERAAGCFELLHPWKCLRSSLNKRFLLKYGL